MEARNVSGGCIFFQAKTRKMKTYICHDEQKAHKSKQVPGNSAYEKRKIGMFVGVLVTEAP